MIRRSRTVALLAAVAVFVMACVVAASPSQAVVVDERAAGQGEAALVVEVPDGATYVVATVTATQAGGEVRPYIRDDVGGWWDGPRLSEVSEVTKERSIPDGMQTITFRAEGYEPGAVGLHVEVVFR